VTRKKRIPRFRKPVGILAVVIFDRRITCSGISDLSPWLSAWDTENAIEVLVKDENLRPSFMLTHTNGLSSSLKFKLNKKINWFFYYRLFYWMLSTPSINIKYPDTFLNQHWKSNIFLKKIKPIWILFSWSNKKQNCGSLFHFQSLL